MASLEGAIRDLQQLLAADSTAPGWRWQVRRLLVQVREALGDQRDQRDQRDQGAHGVEAWLVGRETASARCRRQLQARVATLGGGVLDRLDTETVLTEVRRLHTDLEHHVQRLHDLVYDSVALELGGSE